MDVAAQFDSKFGRTGERNYTYMDPDELDHGLEMQIGNDGILRLNLRAQGDKVRFGGGRDMVLSGMRRLESDGVKVNGIAGRWFEVSDSDNYFEYFENRSNGMSRQESSRS
ncbi:hypothetical protein [Sphingomonas colocasiae]|uniref:Uncharacterized protein n=1 Tax=Sphingomonas colocasiae TaxID=1848973 RepID=A0ABS7PYD9_9SPHN|nr:hypothetical protein [Sphingomonas colocasiae]MBY8826375.1 hypothetical protein [Sphingomonas colocasiae]